MRNSIKWAIGVRAAFQQDHPPTGEAWLLARPAFLRMIAYA
ncbi:hypothetical protein [Cohnella sp. GbtcB17]|nr:hypothetical protein [Cohnella sp. GbtcB17]